MLLWMFNNLFYATFIIGFLFALGGTTVYQGVQQVRQNNAAGRPTSSSRRIALVITSCVFLVLGVVGFVLALYADYVAQGTIINHWASAFIIGVVLVALLYGTLPSVARWLSQRMRNEK